MLDAAVRGASKKPDDVVAAVRALVKVGDRAEQAGYVILARLCDLERGRLLLGAGDPAGRKVLGELARKADKLQLGVIALRARELHGS